jgi:sorbitol/mannitol transport system permease protein
MSVFAEIFTTTGGGPGNASTNVAFLIFKQALMNFDVGVASAARCSLSCWPTSPPCS